MPSFEIQNQLQNLLEKILIENYKMGYFYPMRLIFPLEVIDDE